MTDKLAQPGQHAVMMLYWKADVDAYGRVEKGNTVKRDTHSAYPFERGVF